MIKNLLFVFFLLITGCVYAQDFSYGGLTEPETAMKKYDKDTSAHAVVLQEYGDSRINLDANDNIKLYYYYHVKIKIFDNKGFNKGNVEIPIYSGDNESFERVEEIKGTTFYTDDKDANLQAELDSKKIFTVKQDKHWSLIKFALTNLRNGCIIEYSYKIESPYFLENFHNWQFQDDIPKIYSEYMVHIPAFFNYKATLRGTLKLTKSAGEVETDCFILRGAKNACSKLTYGISNIPAFIEEDYMTAPKNFMSAIYFELEEYTNPYTYVKTKATKEWKDVDYLLKSNEDFGSQLKKKDFFKDHIKSVIATQTNDLDKAKSVYAYLQKWFKWNNYIGIYSTDGVRKAFDAHTGSIADINLSLVAALNAANIPTEAVILSTREHGNINMLYPGIGDFNYVVAKANIGDKSYLLDASDPLLGFGMLPLKCLNDKGRVFSLDKPSYWIDMNNASQREDDSFNFDLTLQDNGKLKGTITHYSMGYSAYEKRKEIKKFNSTDEYVENLDEKLTKLKILKSTIQALDSLDMPITEKYEVEIDAFNNLDHDRFHFEPYFFSRITINPFKLASRGYPVDWGMPSKSNYTIVIHLPQQFAVENAPQNFSALLPNNGGKFLSDFQNDGSSFTFAHLTQFTKSVYQPEEYPYLKEFYNKMIQAEKGEIIFKRK